MYLVNNDRIYPDYLKFDNPLSFSQMSNSDYAPYTHAQILTID